MSKQFSFYPYKVDYDLKIEINNLRVDGKRSDNLIKRKSIDLSQTDWNKILFDIGVKCEGYDGVFHHKDNPNVRCVANIDCRDTQLRICEFQKSSLGQKEFKLEMSLEKRDVYGKVNLNVFIVRGSEPSIQDNKYAERVGQRICVQGEEDHYWNIIIDEKDTEGVDIEYKKMSFKKDGGKIRIGDKNLTDYKDLTYYLDKVATARPILYINEDWKNFIKAWAPLGPEHTKPRMIGIQDMIFRNVSKDIIVQIVTKNLREAASEPWYEEGYPNDDFRGRLIDDWVKRIGGEETTREDFLKRFEKMEDSEQNSVISAEASLETSKGNEMSTLVRGIE